MMNYSTQCRGEKSSHLGNRAKINVPYCNVKILHILLDQHVVMTSDLKRWMDAKMYTISHLIISQEIVSIIDFTISNEILLCYV